MWYAFGLVHYVAISVFFPVPTESFDSIYQKIVKNILNFEKEKKNSRK